MKLLPALSFFLVTALTSTASVAQPAAPATDTTKRVFVSGHSLTDNPLPIYLARIAESLGTPLLWNRQYIVGSAIRYRSMGRGQQAAWQGYRTGLNREGEGLNVIEEFKNPKTIDGKPYDTLVITEQHGVLDSLVTHDTVRYLRHYHERFIEGNAQGRTWFYEPWLGVPDKAAPTRWIAYERAAAPVWQCIISRINTSLTAEGRTDRISSLPASLALAGLVERAMQGRVAGLPSEVPRMMDVIFHDQVHLTPTGYYYVALAVYAAIQGRAPAGAWAPEQVPAPLAAALQQVAGETVATELTLRKPMALRDCADYVLGFKDLYFDHMRDDYWARQEQSWRMSYRRVRHNLDWRWQLWRELDNDPFRYDAAKDKSYWLPAP